MQLYRIIYKNKERLRMDIDIACHICGHENSCDISDIENNHSEIIKCEHCNKNFRVEIKFNPDYETFETACQNNEKECDFELDRTAHICFPRMKCKTCKTTRVLTQEEKSKYLK
jgi:hypothetical protein